MPKSSFTVFFEDPFWVGVYQREDNGQLQVCRVVFGSQPKDYTVYRFLLDNWHRLEFSPGVAGAESPGMPKNPKRAQRAIARGLRQTGMGTKAQQALALARQAAGQAHKAQKKACRQQQQARQFALRTEKRKKKHRGR